jgi:hypothetical protein
MIAKPLLFVGILTSVSWSLACESAEPDSNLPPELPAYALAPCELEARAYRIDAVDVPASISAALAVSLDLDDDTSARPDNAAGSIYAMLAGQYEGRLDQLRASIQAAFDGGRVRWILEVATCADGGNHARIGLHRASDLDGDGVFRVLPYGYLPAVGERNGVHILAREGTAAAPVSALFDVLGAEPDITWVDGYAFTAEIDSEYGDGSISGRLGLGLDRRAFAVAAVPLAAFYTEMLNLGASDYALTLDANADGVITADEFVEDQLMASFAAPDLDLIAPFAGVDVYWPHRDGLEDSISLGLGFTAVPVELEL